MDTDIYIYICIYIYISVSILAQVPAAAAGAQPQPRLRSGPARSGLELIVSLHPATEPPPCALKFPALCEQSEWRHGHGNTDTVAPPLRQRKRIGRRTRAASGFTLASEAVGRSRPRGCGCAVVANPAIGPRTRAARVACARRSRRRRRRLCPRDRAVGRLPRLRQRVRTPSTSSWPRWLPSSSVRRRERP